MMTRSSSHDNAHGDSGEPVSKQNKALRLITLLESILSQVELAEIGQDYRKMYLDTVWCPQRSESETLCRLPRNKSALVC